MRNSLIFKASNFWVDNILLYKLVNSFLILSLSIRKTLYVAKRRQLLLFIFCLETLLRKTTSWWGIIFIVQVIAVESLTKYFAPSQYVIIFSKCKFLENFQFPYHFSKLTYCSVPSPMACIYVLVAAAPHGQYQVCISCYCFNEAAEQTTPKFRSLKQNHHLFSEMLGWWFCWMAPALSCRSS